MSNREDFEKWQGDYYAIRMRDTDAVPFVDVSNAFEAATSASDARYQTRIKELEGALKEICELNYKQRRYELAKVVTKALSTTTPDTALQKALLEARIDENTKMNTATCSATYSLMRAQELQAQLASLNRNETLGE